MERFEDLEWIIEMSLVLGCLQQRYLARMKAKNFLIADEVEKIMGLYNEELENAKSEYADQYGAAVYPPQL